MVSHVNDYGQTRGSRMIGKDCHIRIDLERDVKAGQQDTTCYISKNRPASMTGFAGTLQFDLGKYILTEDLGVPDNDNEESVSGLLLPSTDTWRQTNDVRSVA